MSWIILANFTFCFHLRLKVQFKLPQKSKNEFLHILEFPGYSTVTMGVSLWISFHRHCLLGGVVTLCLSVEDPDTHINRVVLNVETGMSRTKLLPWNMWRDWIQHPWGSWLPRICHALNTEVHTATKEASFPMLFGQDSRSDFVVHGCLALWQKRSWMTLPMLSKSISQTWVTLGVILLLWLMFVCRLQLLQLLVLRTIRWMIPGLIFLLLSLCRAPALENKGMLISNSLYYAINN